MSDTEPPGALPQGLPWDSAEELYEDAPCGYLAALPDGTLVRVNRTFLRWTGYAREELVGRRRFADLLSGGGRIYHETHYAPLLQMQGEVHEIALEIVCASGERLPVLVNSALKRDGEGRPVLIRTTVFDAGERRRYERELLLARDAERAARERTERLQRLTAALAAPLDTVRIAEAVVRAIVDDLGAVEAAVGRNDEEDGALHVLAGTPGAGEWQDAATAVLQAGTARYEDERDGGAVGLVPLVIDGRGIGVLRFALATPGAVAEPDRAFAAAVAAQAAQALERARLLEQTQQAAWRAAYLAEMSRRLYEVHGFATRVERLVQLVGSPFAEAAALEPVEPDAAPAADPAIAPGGGSVTLPLRAQGRSFGSLVLVRHAPRRFSERELPFLAELADRAALALENARLYEQQRDVARVLQRSLLAGAAPRDARFELATDYRPAVESLEVGGDWHDCFPIGADRVGITVGDVVGRGIEAATAMGQLRSAVRALAGAALGPAQVLDRLDVFVEHVDAARYATLAYAEIDLRTGAMVFACAGHPPPVLVEPGAGPCLLWRGRSAPLGATTGLPPRGDAELRLSPGARLLLYTDGLVERRRRPLDQGLERLVAAFGHEDGAPLSALLVQLTGTLLTDFGGDDDVCLLAFRYRGPGVAVTGRDSQRSPRRRSATARGSRRG